MIVIHEIILISIHYYPALLLMKKSRVLTTIPLEQFSILFLADKVEDSSARANTLFTGCLLSHIENTVFLFV